MFRQLILLALASMVLCQQAKSKRPAPVPVEDPSNYADNGEENDQPQPSTLKPSMGRPKKVPVPQSQPSINPYESISVDELLKRPLDTEALQQIMIRAQPGKDYPIYSLDALPQTSFSCANVHQPGFYADMETDCQVFHFCPPTLEGLQLERQTYLCPNMSVFNNRVLVCDWFFNVDCKRAQDLYDLANSRLYQTALPLLDDVPEVIEGNYPSKPNNKPVPKSPKRKPLKPVAPVPSEPSQDQYDAEQ